MREKHMWEVQLRNLGGPNYMRFGPKMYDEDGREVPGSRGYKYFGRARELPGVKELFEELEKPKKKEGGERKGLEWLRKNLGAEYYGYGDEKEEGELERWEREREREAVEKVKGQGGDAPGGWVEIPEGWKVPSLEEVTEFLVERRKARLLQKLG